LAIVVVFVCAAAWKFGGVGNWGKSFVHSGPGAKDLLIFPCKSWSLLDLCGLAGLLGRVPYLLLGQTSKNIRWPKGPRLQFELRPGKTHFKNSGTSRTGYSHPDSLYAEQSAKNSVRFSLIWNGITKKIPEHANGSGTCPAVDA